MVKYSYGRSVYIVLFKEYGGTTPAQSPEEYHFFFNVNTMVHLFQYHDVSQYCGNVLPP